MKRFSITNKQGTMLMYYPNIEIAKEKWEDSTIVEYNDISYLKYIDNIKTGEFLGYDYKNRETYKLKTNTGYVIVKLFKEDNEYIDGCMYQERKTTEFIVPVLWRVTDLKNFWTNVYNNNPIKWNIISFRKYGEPKLSKPKELKDIKQSFSADFIPKKCSCPCFIEGNDLWIKHRDYFSSEWKSPINDFGGSLDYYENKYFNGNKKQKFIYTDSWGSIILRNEAWVKVENIIPIMKNNNKIICRELLLKALCESCKFEITDVNWEIFFENIYKNVLTFQK
jgi:hypothetical protein